MKKIININNALLSLLVAGMLFTFTSCEEDSDGSPDVKPGTPVLESISPTEGQGGTLVTITGTGLGDIQSIVFEKESVPAYVMPTLNTETAILFRVPSDAEGGTQNVVLTNSLGKTLTTEFNVLAYPQVTATSNYNFEEGHEITLTGTNLNDVTSVVFAGTTEEITIVSQVKRSITLSMPATTLERTKLTLTNVTGQTTTSFDLVCLPNTFICYTDYWGPGAYNSGVQSWSYSCNVSESSDTYKTGIKGLVVAYDAGGGLSLFLGSDWGDPMGVFTDWYTPVYFSFWAKGDGSAVDIKIVTDSPPWDGTYSGAGSITVTVPADTWTYFKIPASTWTGKYGRLNLIAEDGGTVAYDDIIYMH